VEQLALHLEGVLGGTIVQVPPASVPPPLVQYPFTQLWPLGQSEGSLQGVGPPASVPPPTQ
jgi:hypothetical protein